MLVAVSVSFVVLTGVSGQEIIVNPAAVVSVRVPRDGEHFGVGVRCLLTTVDGKFIAVVEPCSTVWERLLEGGE